MKESLKDIRRFCYARKTLCVIMYAMFRFIEHLFYKAAIRPLTVCAINRFIVEEVVGLRNIPDNSPAIIVANHSSYLDFLIIPSVVSRRRLRIVAATELKNTGIIGIFARNDDCIYVNRENPAHSFYKQSIKALNNNRLVLIFPEGTRSLNGKLQQFKTAFIKIAYRTKAQIIPVAIKGAFDIWPKNGKIKLKKKCKICFGEPLELHCEKLTKKSEQEYSDVVRSKINNMLEAS